MKNIKKTVKPPHPINYRMEFILLFSNKKSLFSSKKIERTIVFFVFLTITLIYLWRNLNGIRPLEFVEVIGLWLAYGGYNSLMGYRDRKLDNNLYNGSDDDGYGNQYRNESHHREHNNDQNDQENQTD